MKLKTLKNPLMKLSAIVSTYMITSGAHAQESFSNIATTASSNIYAATSVISTTSYVAGAAFGCGGLLSLKKHAENPGNEPINKGIGRLGVGAMLCALPFVMNTAFNSMGVDENASVGITSASGNRLGG